MMRKSGFAVLAAALALVIVTGCESTRAIKNDIKEDIRNEATMRTIETTRLRSAADLKAAYDKRSGESDEVLLLFVNALLLIEENEKEGFAAGAYMSRTADQWSDASSPTGVKPSQAASEGFKRIRDNPNTARSYSGGKPTDYKVTDSGKVVVQIKETRNSSDTETKYYIWSGGKDNASPITLRKAGGKWYVDEWSSLQTGVRK